jgi:hypothetical protein
MSANKQRKALAQAKARARSRKRRLGREPWSHWGRHDGDLDPVVYAVGEADGDIGFLGPAPGVEKMSDVLLEFIEPFQSATPTDDEVLDLARLGAVAWNVALFSEDLRPKEIDRVLQDLPIAATDLFREMVDRKVTHFRDNRRYIVNVDMGERPGGCTLMVASTFEPPVDTEPFLSQ